MKVYAVINQKGGVGKTTTVANLGAALAASGHPTCLIDLDPQGHLTLHFGIEPEAAEASIYEVMTKQADLQSAAVAVGEGLWVVPSTIDLAGAEVELVSTVGREQILRDRINDSSLAHEFVLIDCPPSLGLLTLNALAAADEILIPLQPHFLALHGLGRLLETVRLVQQRINPKLTVAGVIFCMYETTTRLAAEVAADVSAFLQSAHDGKSPWAQARIFTNRIRRNVKLAECPSYGRTIFDYDPSSHGAQDYRALADEFLSFALGRRDGSDLARAARPAGEYVSVAPTPDAPAGDAAAPPAAHAGDGEPKAAEPCRGQPQVRQAGSGDSGAVGANPTSQT